MKILVVDDSNVMRNKISRVAATQSLQIVGLAKDGVRAVEAFQATQPDLVTMDLTMPEMDGVACIRELVALRPDIRILVISALADKATAIEALKSGAMGFLLKPFTDEQLAEALMETMGDGHG